MGQEAENRTAYSTGQGAESEQPIRQGKGLEWHLGAAWD